MIQAFILIKATDKTFSLKIPTVETVYNLLKGINEKKAVGMDNIPNTLLKIAAQVVAPSLTGTLTAMLEATSDWSMKLTMF